MLFSLGAVMKITKINIHQPDVRIFMFQSQQDISGHVTALALPILLSNCVASILSMHYK